ncbi:hypothetical protein [Rhizobium yanglingense]
MTIDKTDIAKTTQSVAVLGANGHTGRFVVTELLRRGLKPIAIGRNAERLAAGRAFRSAASNAVEAVDRG